MTHVRLFVHYKKMITSLISYKEILHTTNYLLEFCVERSYNSDHEISSLPGLTGRSVVHQERAEVAKAAMQTDEAETQLTKLKKEFTAYKMEMEKKVSVFSGEDLITSELF